MNCELLIIHAESTLINFCLFKNFILQKATISTQNLIEDDRKIAKEVITLMKLIDVSVVTTHALL